MSKQETLNRLIDTHEERIIGVLKTLEDRIRADLTTKTKGGSVFNTQFAISYRPNIKTLIQGTYLKEADAIISEYDDIVREYQKKIKKKIRKKIIKKKIRKKIIKKKRKKIRKKIRKIRKKIRKIRKINLVLKIHN